MSLYNIDFFNRELKNIHHDAVDMLSIDDDYLTPETNAVSIFKTDKIKPYDYIYIRGEDDYFGIVTDVSDDENYTTVRFKSFLSTFEQDILFDTDLQSSKTALEIVLKNIIEKYWVNNSDTYQRIPYLEVKTLTSTTSWGFNLKSDTEGMHRCVISLYDVLIRKALSKYGIAINVKPDFNAKKIVLSIGTVYGSIKIDADLANVEIETFSLHKSSIEINKLEILNVDNYTDTIYYYLHNDGSYNTTNNDRITPVVSRIETVVVGTDQTFAQAAASAASTMFSGIEWRDLIELSVVKNDGLVKPGELKIGQTVEIIHDGLVYSSILTGKKYGYYVTLVFGTVRNDLTKKLKLEG